MKTLVKRLDALEAGRSILCPSVKQWLGWPLSDTELAAPDDHAAADPNTIDTTNWSTEAKTWLGID